jgi:uncharacterized protein GlcG (DUF336 family)
MRSRSPGFRAAVVAAAAAGAAAFAAWFPGPPAEAVGPPLTADDVNRIVARCVAFSKRVPGRPKLAIAVVDTEGNSLGVFRMDGLPADPAARDDAVCAALAKAGTGSYFSSDQQTFSTRTAEFIIQDHFPAGVRFTPAGPLYGVEFSSIATSDVNRIFYPPLPSARAAASPPPEAETRVRGDLGGVGLYKNGRRVGGLGVDDGDAAKRVSIPPAVFPGPDCRKDYRLTFRNLERGRALEEIVLAAARGWLAPRDIRSDRILVGGIRLDYSRGSPLGPVEAPPAPSPSDGTWDPDYPPRDAASVPSRFEDFTLDPPAGATPEAQSFKGQVPLAFPVRDSTDGNLSAADVSRVLWQGAQRANVTRAGIRRPIGLAMQCWICVTDTNGELLGAFRMGKPMNATLPADSTLFSFDVAAQKARTAAFFSDERAAFTSRAVGLYSQAFYPAGQEGAGRGPLFQLQDGITVALLGGVFGLPRDPASGGTTLPADLAKIRNGITIFPGGVPLYRAGRVVGGVGVSGDGVDQDDICADFASRGFGAPADIRCDAISGGGVKNALTRVLRRIEDSANSKAADPGTCDTVADKVLSFFYARLADAKRTLAASELDVGTAYTKFPRHPGPVTIRR